MPILVICLLMERKSLILKPTIKILTFQRNFVLEAYLMNLVLLRVVSLNGKCMMFQSITIILINMTN